MLSNCNLRSCHSGFKLNPYFKNDRSKSTENTGSMMYARAASFGKQLSTAQHNATTSSGISWFVAIST